jgi:hypothetical protein
MKNFACMQFIINLNRFCVIFSAILFVSISAPAASEYESRLSDYAYSPRTEEAYMQAWNVVFRSSQTSIFMTFLVSNFGPGDLNNGLSLLVVNNGKNIVHTAEYARKDLQATPGQFGLKCYVQKLWQEGGKIRAYVNVKDVEIHLTLTPATGGVRLSGGNVPLGGNSFFRADIPVMAASGSAVLKLGNTRQELKGTGGMEYIGANKSAHSFSKRFTVIRTFSAARGVFAGGLQGAGGFADYYRLALMERGKIVAFARISEYKILQKDRHAASGYELPSRFDLQIEGQPCKLEITRQGYIGGFHVLGNVSALLRWVLSVFFAKPYIMQFNGNARLACSGKPTLPAGMQGSNFPVQISFYPINP